MIDATKLITELKSGEEEIRDKALMVCRGLSRSDLNELLLEARKTGLSGLFTAITGQNEPFIDKNISLPPALKLRRAPVEVKEPEEPRKLENYGIYTVGDANFFPGIVAAINSLRYYGCQAPVGVIDIGFEPWMVEYLDAFEKVKVLDIRPVREIIRYTDLSSDELPVMRGWAYKAFGIVHYNLFDSFTFIDADFLPLCDLEKELGPLIAEGRFISTEDGLNTWDARHKDAVGVEPGSYMNINAGFISLDMERYGYVVHEWRNLMTRRKPFELWYGDQGALNAILDKYGVEKHTVDKELWNQTWLNENMAEEDCVEASQDEDKRLILMHKKHKKRIYSWHGTGWHKLWHQIGIDHFRKSKTEREKFFAECQGKSPSQIARAFNRFLFMDEYNRKLERTGHLLK